MTSKVTKGVFLILDLRSYGQLFSLFFNALLSRIDKIKSKSISEKFVLINHFIVDHR